MERSRRDERREERPDNYNENMPMVRGQGMPDTYRDDYRDIYRGYRRDRAMKAQTNAFHDQKNYKKYENEAEIFERVIGHMTKGVMFHDRMMDLYGFLGLEGLKKLHEYQYYDESMNRRDLKCYMLETLNMIAEDVNINDNGLDFLPQAWFGYTRHEITPEMKKQAIMPSFEAYKQWEDETKELLSYCASELMYMGKVADSKKLTEMVEDVEDELKEIDSLVLKIGSTDFDMKYLVQMQDDLLEKYEKKLKKCFEEKIEHDKKKMHKWEDDDDNAFEMRRRSMRTGRFIR